MFYIFALFVSIYLLISSSIEQSDVGGLRLEVAGSIVERLDLNVPVGTGMAGSDGREYSWFGIGSVLLSLPLYILGKILGNPPLNLVLLLNPLFGAATVTLVFLFTNCLGYSRRSSLFVSILYGLGTMALYYGKDPGDHTLETFFILLCFFGMYRFIVSGRIGYIIMSGASLGMAFLTRGNSIIIMPPLLLMFWTSYIRSNHELKVPGYYFRGIIPFCSAMIPFICIFFWYNNYRFGSIFESGYTLMANRLGIDFFSGTPFITGLAGLLASPGKGFFYYSPITILFFFSIRSFWKNHPAVAVGFAGTIVIFILFYARNIYWHGDWAWGPRYLFAVTPFFVIPIAELIDRRNWMKRRCTKTAVYSLLVCGIVIQLLAVSVTTPGYFKYLHSVKKIPFTVVKGSDAQPIIEPPLEMYFTWRLSPIIGHAEMLYSIISRMVNIKYQSSVISDDDIIDFWWIRRYFTDKSCAGFFVVPLIILYIIFAATRLRAVSSG
jgi:hypothetical protein